MDYTKLVQLYLLPLKRTIHNFWKKIKIYIDLWACIIYNELCEDKRKEEQIKCHHAQADHLCKMNQEKRS